MINKVIGLGLFLIFLNCIGSVSAINITTGSGTYYNNMMINLSFWSTDNSSCYLIHDQNNFSLNFTGVNPYVLYNETADMYDFVNGSWVIGANIYDGDWGTWGYSDNYGELRIDYEKPQGAYGAYWNKSSTEAPDWVYRNITITSDCWNSNLTHLRLRILSNEHQDNLIMQCDVSGSWETLWESGTGVSNHKIREEGMFWLMGGYNYSEYIVIGSQDNNLTIVCDNPGGKEVENITVSYSILCNSSFIDDTICNFPWFDAVSRCKRIGYDQYQWDKFNMTYCDYGCYNGACLQPVSMCRSRCVENETTCMGKYVVHCLYDDYDGCWRWNESQKVYCDNMCDDGKCVDYISTCNDTSLYCEDGDIYKCEQQDEGHSILVTHQRCEYGCEVDVLNSSNVTCLIVGDAHRVANSFHDIGYWSQYIFQPMLLLVYLLFSIGIGLFLSIKLHSGIMGFWVFIILMFVGTYFNVVPIYITFVIMILGFLVKLGGGRT